MLVLLLLLVGKKRTTSRWILLCKCIARACKKRARVKKREERERFFRKTLNTYLRHRIYNGRESSSVRKNQRESEGAMSVSLSICVRVRAHARHGIHFSESKDVYVYI